MADRLTIRNAHLAATFAAKGAELQSLVTADGIETVWSGDPVFWGWHAPNLFPIVGGLADDTLVHEGRQYPIKQHGFLRHSVCEIAASAATSCAFRLADNAETRAQYPFAFDLRLEYRLNADRLEAAFVLDNPAETTLYAGLGIHPAFCWPLAGGDRASHVVTFEKPEPAPIRRIVNRLIEPAPVPTPVEGRVLRLDDTLFDHDALVFDRLESRLLTYGAPGALGIEVGFPDFPDLGIWSKPGPSPFVCLEPWQGMASPAGFAGDFAEKPGIVAIAAGQTRIWRYWIRPFPPAPSAG